VGFFSDEKTQEPKNSILFKLRVRGATFPSVTTTLASLGFVNLIFYWVRELCSGVSLYLITCSHEEREFFGFNKTWT
jgi:hypothetical protein